MSMLLRHRAVWWAAGIWVVGYATFAARQAGNERLLATAEVRLVQADGSPAVGVPVEARWTRYNGGTGLARMMSGPDGRVDLERIAQNEHPALWSYKLQAQVPGGSTEWSRLEAKLDLVVPDIVVLALFVQDKDGQPWSSDDLEATVRCNGAVRRVPLALGRTEFPVAAGGELHVAVQLQAHRFAVDVDVPKSPARRHEVVLRLPSDCAVASGRCVDAAGTPLTGMVVVILGEGRDRQRPVCCRLGAGGVFRLVCDEGKPPLHLRFHGARGTTAERSVLELAPDGEAVLGDVVLK